MSKDKEAGRETIEQRINRIVNRQKTRRVAIGAMSDGYTRKRLQESITDIDFLLEYCALLGRVLNEVPPVPEPENKSPVTADITLPPMSEENAKSWDSFVEEVKKPANEN